MKDKHLEELKKYKRYRCKKCKGEVFGAPIPLDWNGEEQIPDLVCLNCGTNNLIENNLEEVE